MINWSELIRYARTHRVIAVMAGVTAVAAASAVLGGVSVPVPSARGGSGSVGIPFRRELPLLSGVFLTAALGGHLAAYDAIGGARAHRVRAVYAVVLTTTACGVSFLAEAFAAGPVMGIVFIRSMLVWLGLSLLSLRLFGQQLTWVLPLASAFPLVWFSDNAWWDWTAAPATDHVGWITAGLALIAGTAAMAVTPWRRRTLLGLGTPAVRGRARP